MQPRKKIVTTQESQVFPGPSPPSVLFRSLLLYYMFFHPVHIESHNFFSVHVIHYSKFKIPALLSTGGDFPAKLG